MPGTINNIVTTNVTTTLTVEPDDDAAKVLLGEAETDTSGDRPLTDLVGQVLTAILAVTATGAGTTGRVTGQLYTGNLDADFAATFGPTFVLPSRLAGQACSFMVVVTGAPGQTLGGVGLAIADVGGDDDTTYTVNGVTVIVSD